MSLYAFKFEKFAKIILEAKGYKVLESEASAPQKKGMRADYIALSPQDEQTVVEIKFYGSSKVPLGFLRKSIHQIIQYKKTFNATRGLIITSALIGKNAIESVTGTAVEVWDYGVIREVLSQYPEALQELDDLIKEAHGQRPETMTGHAAFIPHTVH